MLKPSISRNHTKNDLLGLTGKKTTPRPCLKWVGGKGQLTHKLFELIPKQFANYHEPMVGGGAFFFALFREDQLDDKMVYLTDFNQELMDTYQVVRDQTPALIRALEAHRYDRDHFYAVRALDPASLSPVERAARMIFLNRTGFNGLYRVNRQGQFNVPFGAHKNPRICDSENLLAVSKTLLSNNNHLHCGSFESVLDRACENDLVYFDPPYVPLSDTSYFVSYSKKGFDLADQENLAQVFTSLAERGVQVMLSNSASEWVRNRYKDFVLVEVPARRNINSKADRRGKISELVVLSYKP